jgi:osmoprotectant transport system permease protein
MTVIRDKVLFLLWLVAAAATASTGFVTHAANRLVSGAPVLLADAVSGGMLALVVALAGGLLVAAVVRPTARMQHVTVALSAAALIVILVAAGRAATVLVSPDHPAARTSLGPAFWIASLCAVLTTANALQQLRAGPLQRLAVAAAVAAVALLVVASGALDDLSLLREYATRRQTFGHEIAMHCGLVAAAVGPALLIGTPLGVLAARRAGWGARLFATLNILQTVPSIALFGLLIGPLSALAAAVPALRAAGVAGIGFFPAAVALIAYSLLPVARNTQAAIAAVRPEVVDAARGLGFTQHQIFWRIELPLGLPVFLAGVRIVLVQAIGLAVVAGLIGAGGLGAFVFQGLGQYAIDLVLLGAVPAMLMALAADLLLRTAVELAARRRRR